MLYAGIVSNFIPLASYFLFGSTKITSSFVKLFSAIFSDKSCGATIIVPSFLILLISSSE